LCLKSIGKPFVYYLVFVLFGVGLAFELRAWKAVFYHLSHTSSPFCSGYFRHEVLELFSQTGLEPQSSDLSQVTGITGMSHLCPI
jgi:hypothetical protein